MQKSIRFEVDIYQSDYLTKNLITSEMFKFAYYPSAEGFAGT